MSVNFCVFRIEYKLIVFVQKKIVNNPQMMYGKTKNATVPSDAQAREK